MKIALVNPPPRSELEKHWADVPVLGLAYVAAALRQKGHHVVVLDGKLGALSIAQIRERVRAEEPHWVGITSMTVDFPTVMVIAKGLRQDGIEVPIVVGGPHINAVASQALEECAELDFACVGEGEHLTCELSDAILRRDGFGAIAGLSWRRGSTVEQNPAREYHDDYDKLPFPAWDLFAATDHIPLLTHRGCPFECNFCGHNSGFKPRYRSPENVLTEIEEIVDRFAPRLIRFEDETFGLNLPRTIQILRGILERGLHRRVLFSAQTRVDRMDAELVRLLRLCNFETLELGVESGNDGVLARMGKGIKRVQVENAVRLAKQEGLIVECKFILGHPHETFAEILDTARFIAKLNPDRLSVSIMTPYPGTPIFDMAVRGEGGYRLLSRDWSSFDKYASGAVELEGVSLSMLKACQIACYLGLYLGNGRVTDLFRLLRAHRGVVAGMAMGLLTALLRKGPTSVPQQGVTRAQPPLPLSDVAMPDSTLIQLRRRGNRSAPTAVHELRTWAAPGRAH